jgi:nicotinate-nucleotide adenylyltransferase
MSKRVAIYGGSFNPPHVGHVLAVAYALVAHPVDEIHVVPCFVHPFSKELAPFEDRFAMCAQAMGWMPRVVISRVEAELGGESRTLRTLEHLREQNPSWAMRLLVGADILHDAPKWHGFDRVTELAPLLVLGRAGITEPSAPEAILPEVSSTEIRSLFAQGNSERLAALVPREVIAHARQRGLYGLTPGA